MEIPFFFFPYLFKEHFRNTCKTRIMSKERNSQGLGKYWKKDKYIHVQAVWKVNCGTGRVYSTLGHVASYTDLLSDIYIFLIFWEILSEIFEASLTSRISGGRQSVHIKFLTIKRRLDVYTDTLFLWTLTPRTKFLEPT